jgi:hypothetical protein
VGQYVERLEASGLAVKWDRNLHGQAFDAQLKQWIDEASAIVVFWSSTSTTRAFVQGEVNYSNIAKIVNVRIDPIDVRSIPLQMNTLDVIDLSTSDSLQDSEGLLKLIARCAELCGIALGRPSAHIDRNSGVEATASRQAEASIVVTTNDGGVVAGTINGPVMIAGSPVRR